MGGKFRINGKDAYSTYGVFLGNNSIESLLLPPSAKKRISNESRLLPGKQVIDGKNNVCSRDVTLVFYFQGSNYVDIQNKITSFTTELLEGIAIFTLNELPIIKFKLDYDSSSSLKQCRGRLAKISMKFNEPDPTDRS